ncbi:MAG: methyltransferase domain-containing protein [Tissierellia bacterium]|nr:methyltransferase domain-containing protein [Tissierellia bacterium]
MINFKSIENYIAKPFGKNIEYAVGIILFKSEVGYEIIFEKRSSKVSQPGDISLPGGRVEDDESRIDCALREIKEEIGIDSEDLKIIGESDFVVEPVGVVYPYVFEYRYGDLSRIDINEEVEEVLSISLDYFIENDPSVFKTRYDLRPPEDFPVELISRGEEYDFYPLIREYFIYEKMRPVIWGLTAKIISGFIRVLREEKNINKEEIKNSVANFYRDIAKDEKRVVVNPDILGDRLGYTKDELNSVPKEANLGLGCGNPQEKACPKEAEKVLDLGCGKGMDVFIASKKVGADGYVIGVDMTYEMIKKAREIADKRDFKNVEFRLSEIENLAVSDNSMDLVISNCVINLSTDKQRVYSEIYRVLKEGGRIGISDIILAEELPREILNDPKMYGT